MKPTDLQPASDSMLFRTFSFHEDDYGKPIIRINEQYMRKLGVSSGDIVKISGNRKVPAIVIPHVSNQKPNPNWLRETGRLMPQSMGRAQECVMQNPRLDHARLPLKNITLIGKLALASHLRGEDVREKFHLTP